jgi:prevent-host-death family protein
MSKVERIGIRELRQNASVYVDMVWREGVTVEITNRGRLAARIVPVEESSDTLGDLVRAGIVERPDSPGGLRGVRPLPSLPDGPTLSDVLLQARDEERY